MDATRLYSEQTMTWVTWYLGGITIVLAIVGVGLLLQRLVARPDAAVVLVLTEAGAGTALYLLSPQITPTQIWAMRRYVPAALPFLFLAAAFATASVVAVLPRLGLGRPWNRIIPVAAAVGIFAFPLGVTLPVANYRTQVGFLGVVDNLCATVGPDAAVMVAAKDSLDPEHHPDRSQLLSGPGYAWMIKPITAARVSSLGCFLAVPGSQALDHRGHPGIDRGQRAWNDSCSGRIGDERQGSGRDGPSPSFRVRHPEPDDLRSTSHVAQKGIWLTRAELDGVVLAGQQTAGPFLRLAHCQSRHYAAQGHPQWFMVIVKQGSVSMWWYLANAVAQAASSS